MKYLASTLGIAVALCASRADSQTFTTLVQFTGTSGTASGWDPQGSLAVSGTTLYGMTLYGGTNTTVISGGTYGYGNIFSVGVDGTNYQNLLSFTRTGGAANGARPEGNLTVGGTTLYGMTSQGGTQGFGNLFSVGADGTNYQNLISFSGSGGTASGKAPYTSNLTLAGTTLCGMTELGGANSLGNIFSVGTDGITYRNLVSFTGNGGTAIGALPLGSLTVGGTTFYGLTNSGGSNGDGSIFRVGTDGTSFQSLVSFPGGTQSALGETPYGSLTLGGTTLYGMTTNGNNIFSVGVNGTNYHSLLTFTGTGGTASGNSPHGSLILSGTTLYGMTPDGGVHGHGNIFSVGINGTGYQDLYDFGGGADGARPFGDLTLSGGTLFGMTALGGNLPLNGGFGDGTVFALVVPEPCALALAGAAAAVLVANRWRKRRSRRRY